MPNVVNAARTPLLDRAHLARQTIGDAELADELLGLFRDQGRATLATLPTADDRTALGAVAHRLKGAAAAVGALQVVAAADALEAATADPAASAGRVAQTLVGLVAATERTLAAIAAATRRRHARR